MNSLKEVFDCTFALFKGFKLDQKMFKWWKEEAAADMLLLFVGLMILLFYPFFVWGEKTISAAGGDFPIQSIIFLHKAPMDYKMIWTTINLYRSLILARSHNDLIYSRFVSLSAVQMFKTSNTSIRHAVKNCAKYQGAKQIWCFMQK